MSLVVEDGTGKSDAESYITLVEADAYILAHSNDTTWDAASDSDKEKAIRLATQYLDANYGGKWKGLRSSESQALDWPRSNVKDNDEYYLASNEIPQKLKDANSEVALREILDDTLLGAVDAAQNIKSEGSKAGPVSERIEYIGVKSNQKKYPLVDALLSRYIDGSQVERG